MRSYSLQGQPLKIDIRRQRRKSLMMKTVTGGVIVYIPSWLKPNSREVREFIQNGLKQLEADLLPAREERTTKAQLKQSVRTWARRMNVQPKRISFRPMQRKWGSCSSIGNVTLNSTLTTLPPDLAEYVIVHELAHLVEFNHSQAFWSLVEVHLPDYARRKSELDQYPV